MPVITMTCMKNKKQVKGKQPVNETANRTGTPQTFYLTDDLLQAINAYLAAQKFKPSKKTFFSTAIKAYLESEGFWPPATGDADDE